MARSEAHLAQESEVSDSIPDPAIYFRISLRSLNRGSCQLLAKVPYVHLVLVNRLGDQNLPRNSVVRLIDRPDIPIAVYRGREAIREAIQQQFTVDVKQYVKQYNNKNKI